jgi:hypothetical protein
MKGLFLAVAARRRRRLDGRQVKAKELKAWTR